MISLSLASIILGTQKIKIYFYIKIKLQKNQGTKWVQIRELEEANGYKLFLPTLNPLIFGVFSILVILLLIFPMANKKEAIGH